MNWTSTKAAANYVAIAALLVLNVLPGAHHKVLYMVIAFPVAAFSACLNYLATNRVDSGSPGVDRRRFLLLSVYGEIYLLFLGVQSGIARLLFLVASCVLVLAVIRRRRGGVGSGR